MTTKHRIIWLLAVALALALVEVAASGEIVKHSGSLVAVNQAAGTLTLAEVGPWRHVGGVTQVDERVVAVTPDTRFARVRRAADGGPGYARDYVVEPLAAWQVAPGEFVTIACRHEGQRMTALDVTVATPEQ
jgi:hypothetical protein